jgi:hypothetical protein
LNSASLAQPLGQGMCLRVQSPKRFSCIDLPSLQHSHMGYTSSRNCTQPSVGMALGAEPRLGRTCLLSVKETDR